MHHFDDPFRTQRRTMMIMIMKRPRALLFIPRSPPPHLNRSRIPFTIQLDIPHLHIIPSSTSLCRPGARVRHLLFTLAADCTTFRSQVRLDFLYPLI